MIDHVMRSRDGIKIHIVDLYIAVDKVSCPVLTDLLRILRLSRFKDEISRFLDISLLE
jgi:hypothetical protein